MSLPELLLYGQACASVLMIIGWLVALRINNTSYVDVLWAYGVGILGFAYLFLAHPPTDPNRLLVLQVLVVLWSLRLGTYLLSRCRKKPEDARYAYLREYMGKRADFGFFVFFQVQAFWVVLFASPFLILAGNPNPLGPLDYTGLGIWLAGFTGLNLADRQLARFKEAPGRTRAEVCESGLWKYSRHPNYFFEWILWLGYIPMGWAAPEGSFLIALPFVLYLFLTKITGIPFVEARKLEASGDSYRSYVERTSSFFPWFPKSKNSDS
jgi:steroid 5-alpha reductase family enzyme